MKKVFITGGSRGIGQAIVEKFKAENYTVIAPTRKELDLLSEESIDTFLANYKEHTFDVIINNAGINDINLIENISDEEINRMINTNLVAPIKILRAFIPKMKTQGFGRIINIASIWAMVSKPKRTLYASTKNAIHGITNTLALELGEYNILVNTVCPGFTLTELTKKNNTPEEIKQISHQIPLQRMANPHEIAEFIFFLASEKNSYITGQKICIDGGYTAQ